MIVFICVIIYAIGAGACCGGGRNSKGSRVKPAMTGVGGGGKGNVNVNGNVNVKGTTPALRGNSAPLGRTSPPRRGINVNVNGTINKGAGGGGINTV